MKNQRDRPSTAWGRVIESIRRFARGWVPIILLFGGICMMTWGICMIYYPAGWIFAGLAVLVAGVLMCLDSGGDNS
jgi:hypothetical protein